LVFSLSGCTLLQLLLSMNMHTSTRFDDISYTEYNMTYFDALCADIRDMLADKTSETTVMSKFSTLYREVNDIYTMYALATIYNAQDVTDAQYQADYLKAYETATDAQNKAATLGHEIVTSYCAEYAKTFLGEMNYQYYLDYQEQSEALTTLLSEEQTLIAKYNSSAAGSFGTIINAQEVTFENYYTLGLSEQEQTQALTELYRQKNAVLAPIYGELVELRGEILDESGYDSYADFCYDTVFFRDYTNDDTSKVYESVREYCVPLLEKLSSSYTVDEYASFYYAASDWSDDMLFNKVGSKFDNVVDGMSDALGFMKKYGYYSLEYSETKMDASFTTMLYSYNAPYMFIQPSGSTYDVFTFVHEFGHYNAMYTNPSANVDMDTTEVFSTGLELLYMKNYNTVFGNTVYKTAEKLILEDMLRTTIMGCLIDEFESTVYEENITDTHKLNELMATLYNEYGLTDSSQEVTELYSWVDVVHLYLYPFYYISYAASTVTSLDLWLQSLDNYNSAVRKYESIINETGENSFTQIMETLDVLTIFDEDAMKSLTERIKAYAFTE
ncbi:MAG TPA: hypothetical protein PLT66_07645, partial [Bacillota bacterium]|nr:hypothetical protein [Bacillota bacterium]